PRSGAEAFSLLLRVIGISVDPAQLHHRFGGGTFGFPEMLRAAKELGLKARVMTKRWTQLARTPLPAIAELNGGAFVVLPQPRGARCQRLRTNFVSAR
ncbi:MAG TPA: cysteine peptidase family C39 domain-containing protein, partial [Pseudolabrys sp.]